ncbi:MAG: carbohydrate ABC transporter permease [Proteobacteria bacterium]|mgnify:FL=1|jgi:raffinose/stachyose/melibiose transport system permease protein|nr:carbohydrate ABC transporter permease [Pseudomonadota bacterium]MDB0003308.1 carbohydrate ABC transporter permease [Alphaproteobacteria bacterium]MDC0343187.1 carbohydrate ABC transporter permease [Alphaproteobacteria bacterium]
MQKDLSSNFYFIFKWVIIISFVFYAVFPFLWLVLASLKTNAELLNNPFTLPEVFQFKNYSNAIQEAGLGRLIINSLVISTSATFLNILFSSMCAFAIARHTFWGNNVLFLMITAGILVPLNALIIPYFAIINFLNLYDTRIGLIIVYCAVGLPVSTFILTEFFKSIPKEIEEASYLDGCNFAARYFKIMLPLALPGLATAGTFQFILCWNEFIYAMLLTSSTDIRTIQFGISYFTNQFFSDYVGMFAAVVISIIPSITVFILFQEKVINGLTAGSVKG